MDYLTLITNLLKLASEYGPEGLQKLREIASIWNDGTADMTEEELAAHVATEIASQDMVSAHLQAHKRNDGTPS